jgi:hypothetical protein
MHCVIPYALLELSASHEPWTINRLCVEFEFLTALVMEIKTATFWDISSCSPYMNRRLGRIYHLHLQGRKSAEQESVVPIDSPAKPGESSEPMGTEQHPFLLPSGPYIIVIPTDSSFRVATCSRSLPRYLHFELRAEWWKINWWDLIGSDISVLS